MGVIFFAGFVFLIPWCMCGWRCIFLVIFRWEICVVSDVMYVRELSWFPYVPRRAFPEFCSVFPGSPDVTNSTRSDSYDSYVTSVEDTTSPLRNSTKYLRKHTVAISGNDSLIIQWKKCNFLCFYKLCYPVFVYKLLMMFLGLAVIENDVIK